MREARANKGRGKPTLIREISDRQTQDVSWALTPEQIDAIMSKANFGDSRDLCRLATEIMDKDENIIQALETRKNAVMGCAWHLEPGDGGGPAIRAAEELQAELETCGGQDGQDGFEDLMEDLVKTIVPGYLVSEILWVDGGHIAGFHRVPGTAMHFLDSYQPRVVTVEHPLGMELPRDRYIFHHLRRDDGEPSRGGLIRPLAWLHCFRSTNVKDLLSFIERHGMPFIVAKVDQAAFLSEKDQMRRLVRAFGPSGGGVVTKNVEMELLESHSTGDVFFRLLEYVKDAVDRLILGQTASSNDGAGLSGGDAQSKVRQDILEADCRRVMRAINLQVCKPWATFNHGDIVPPRLVIDYSAPEDRLQLAQTVQALAGAGLVTDEEEMSVRFGMKLKRALPEPSLSHALSADSGKVKGKSQAMGQEDAGKNMPGAVLSDWLNPAAKLLERLASDELSDDEFERELQRLRDRDSELFGDSEPFERALEGVIADNLVVGAAAAWRKTGGREKA